VIVDAHQHLWDPSLRRYPFLEDPALEPLRRPFTVNDLWEVTEGRVAATVLVQTVSARAETEEFLATAAASDGLIRGVVGWVDLTAGDVAEQLGKLRAGPGGERLVGIRHQVQDEPDPMWLARADVRRGIAAVGAAGLVYDLLVLTPQLAAAREVAAALPEVPFVLDHLAKPPIAAGEWEPWASGVAALAALPNVTAKVSGLVTEAVWDDWDAERIGRYADHAMCVFGTDRVMFGSDWPVCTLAASYADVFSLGVALTAGLSGPDRADVFGETATRVYGLPD
jgi:L-fuconolactonase